ncbi:hypothetical protein [Aquiflexum sp.]|uniref:hypothetical protein n=1 Tax=Aquiflexum sp. TaxID=1872584 RepID=UPI0035936D8B
MKIGFLITLLVTGIHFSTIAQETSEGKIFDYSETKHELSLDFAPIIQGNYPSSLLYRQHYVSKNGKNVAFRVGAHLGANIASTENSTSTFDPDLVDRNNQNLNVFLGKEWQKQIQSRIIGYYGADLNLGYSRSSFNVTAGSTNQTDFTIKENSYSIGTIGFLGIRYHFSKHFSASVETGADLGFYSYTTESNANTNTASKSKSKSLGFGMIPLRAIRFSFHF